MLLWLTSTVTVWWGAAVLRQMENNRPPTGLFPLFALDRAQNSVFVRVGTIFSRAARLVLEGQRGENTSNSRGSPAALRHTLRTCTTHALSWWNNNNQPSLLPTCARASSMWATRSRRERSLPPVSQSPQRSSQWESFVHPEKLERIAPCSAERPQNLRRRSGRAHIPYRGELFAIPGPGADALSGKNG